LSDGDTHDINETQLFIELGDLGSISPEDTATALQVLQFLTSLESSITAYEIMLRVPLEMMTEDGSVSKFNIIQNYLWTTTAQEKLGRLAV